MCGGSSRGRVVKLQWLAEQENRGKNSIPGLATWIFRDLLSPASKSRYGWNTAEVMQVLNTTNQLYVCMLISTNCHKCAIAECANTKKNEIFLKTQQGE